MSSNKKTGYSIDMCSGPLLPKMLLFALPLMLSSVLQLLFNAADLVVVSRFAGDNAMAAVGANSSLIGLMVNFLIGIAVGANVQAARERGAGLSAALNKTVHTSVALALLGGVGMATVGILGARVFLMRMGAPEAILDQAILYLRIYFLGTPANVVYNFGAALLRSVGDTRRPLRYLTFAGVVNVILNLILVIVFHLDVAGVAIATVTSQTISALLVLRCLMREEGDIRLELRKLRIHRESLSGILRMGLPSGIQNSLFSLSNVVIQSAVNGFGEIVVAGWAAAVNLEGFMYCAVTGFKQATLSFTGQNVGARRIDRIPRIMGTALICMSIASIGIAAVSWFFGESLVGIYSSTEEVVQAGMARILITGSLYFLCGFMEIVAASTRGMGQSLLPMIVSLIGACAFRLLWVSTIFQIPAYHTIHVIYISYPVSWFLTFLAHLVCWVFVMKRMKNSMN